MKILIWGTGFFARQLLSNDLQGEIIGFVETQKSQDMFRGYPVYGAGELPEQYDMLVVANSFSDEIYELCELKEIAFEKVIFMIKGKKHIWHNELPLVREGLGEGNFTLYQAEYGILEDGFIEEDIKRYNALNTRPSFAIKEENMWRIATDKYAMAGMMENYFWQDLWAAKKIIADGVTEHFDIGSRLDGFIAHLLAAEIKVNMIDIRKFPGEVENLDTIVDDATLLRNIPDESIGSMSALCSLEHFGLGRYGDPIDPEACFLCFEQIQKKLKPGGKLYISLPVGKERVEFNAHRVFYAATIKEAFHSLELKEFSCTAEQKLEKNVDIHKYDEDNHNGNYRYGLFYFVKR